MKYYFDLQINRLVPVVKNLYQTQRQILWGFTHSLISKELLDLYTWTGRSEKKNKHSFTNLVQIQNLLYCAMLKVDTTYTVISFENDFKTNLLKCAARSKTNNVLTLNDSNV